MRKEITPISTPLDRCLVQTTLEDGCLSLFPSLWREVPPCLCAHDVVGTKGQFMPICPEILSLDHS